uniref:Uncharacterized protein n=1 Tax=Oryza brachyantha TaxID=4533 RepID=J3MWC2_ORYBR
MDLMASRQCFETANNPSGCKIPLDDNGLKPKVMSIGPYYHDPLKGAMEQEKAAMLYDMLQAWEQQKPAMLTSLLKAVSAVEKEARENYFDRVPDMSSHEFVEMLLLDACYILAKFVLPYCCTSTGTSTASQTVSAMHDMELVRDIFYLLGNQIPFCALEKIHEVLHGGSSMSMPPGTTVVTDTLLTNVRQLLQHFGYSIRNDTLVEPWHLHHLLYMHFQPHNDGSISSSVAQVDSGRKSKAITYRWRAATYYRAAGVIFRKRHLDHGASKKWWFWFVDGGARSILDVRFDGLTLRIPSLMVDNNTYTVLRNLMMLEQHNPDKLGSHVTAYCVFLSQIAGTASDVALLVKMGIIVHLMANDIDVANMLSRLCSGITIDLDEPKHNYLHKTRKDVERTYKNRTIRCGALLWRRHFRNPLLAIAMVAAVVAFSCQIIQAYYTYKAYKP